VNGWTDEDLRRLRSILATLYPMTEDGVRLARDAQLATGHIHFSSAAITNWFHILERAKNEGGVDRIVDLAFAENPNNDALRAARDHVPPPPVEGPEPQAWTGVTGKGQLEKIIGARSTLVSISHLELGIVRARSVARIRLADGSSGTGFVVAGNLLVTNAHVLPDVASAATALAQFNYQQTIAGTNAPLEEFRLAPANHFHTSPKNQDDWTVVRIDGDVSKWGEIEMKPRQPAVGEHVNIIQHPGGAQKQISFAANVIVFVGDGRVQYLTDTLPGSSGSPVFDSAWNLVALHHSGGWLTEPNAPSKTTYYRNEGIAIERVIAGLA
jgi:V8-like Glu-specific endopeptidase